MPDFTVTTLADSGAGSLRAAIQAANAAPSGTPTAITFAVSGTISLASDLPAISNSVTIDATSVPGATGTPAVELDCNSHGGLVFAAGSDGSRLLGMAIGNASGNGVTLDAGTITLAGNYIGLASDGSALGNGGDGLYVAATSSNNDIGSNPTAASGVVSNVISNNAGNGISLHGSSGNTLVDNRVGTDATGTIAMANGANGIWVTDGSTNNTIGGTAFVDTATGAVNDPTGDKGTVAPVFVVPPLGNLVSGNGANGILIDANSQDNVLNGNFVGTTADGNGALGNVGDGVNITDANNNSLIGCQFVNNPFVYYNVLSANGGNGLHVTDSNNVTVQANFFGVGANNATLLGNALNGILVDGSSQDVTVGGVIPLGNVSGGNALNGIEVTGTASGFTTFNTFGGLFAFGGAAPNGNDGLLLNATGGNQDVQTNVFSGNSNNGIEIGGDASGVTVDPNISGLNTRGDAILSNGGDGLLIDGTAHGNTVGGYQSSVIPQDTFSGNLGYGIEITDQAHDNQVFNTYVGVDVAGSAAIGNGAGGVLVGDNATGNVIGGPTGDQPVAVVISGNTGNGVTLTDGTSANSILNNTIGYGAHGFLSIPNSGLAIEDSGTGNVLSGNLPCFAAGTRIATPDGEVAVEDLRVGDMVSTVAAEALPVRWIGHRTIDCARHPEPTEIRPIRVRAHAFAPGQPTRDLLLSPDHAILVEGVLIPVRHLVNDTTITQLAPARVSYFHVELTRHAAILADGLPVESYLDTGNRRSFANGPEPVLLHADFAGGTIDNVTTYDALGCAPLRVTGPEIERARATLAARGTTPGAVRKLG